MSYKLYKESDRLLNQWLAVCYRCENRPKNEVRWELALELSFFKDALYLLNLVKQRIPDSQRECHQDLQRLHDLLTHRKKQIKQGERDEEVLFPECFEQMQEVISSIIAIRDRINGLAIRG